MATYVIEGKRYAAASLAQAIFAHRKAVGRTVLKPRPLTTEEAAYKARTQPYYEEKR